MRIPIIRLRWPVAAVVMLAAVGLVAPRAAQARPPAGGEEAAKVVAAIEALADHPSGMVKLFAKRLVDVLNKDAYKDKVALSAKLKALQVAPNQVNPKDEDLAKVHEAVAKIIEPAPCAE